MIKLAFNVLNAKINITLLQIFNKSKNVSFNRKLITVISTIQFYKK